MSKRLKYSEKNLLDAMEATRSGMSIRKASITFNVPRSTLMDKLGGRVPIERRIGPSTILSCEEEGYLVKWIMSCSKAGFPVTKTHLTDSVQLLMRELKRENPFPDDRPSRHWHEAFMKRHPEIVHRVCQNLSGQRSNVSEVKIRQWFKEVSDYFGENKTSIDDPRRIYNCDETAMYLCPKGEKVLTEKGQKTVYNVALNDEKECLTTLVMCNAAGELPPPLVMFSYKRIPNNITQKFPKTWAIGKSENGWMTGESFFEYIANIFFPWLTENKIELPIILYVDGHTSHLTMQLSNFCSDNGIILTSLYPNSTHILQPLDVAFFHPLKMEWRKQITRWRMEHLGAKLSKEDFAPLLKTTFDNMMDRLPSIIKNGFLACGLHPFNPNNIKFEKFFEPTVIRKEQNTEQIKVFLNFFERENVDKIGTFKSSGNIWQGDIQDKSLFYFWQSLKKRIQDDDNNNAEEVPDQSPPPSTQPILTAAADEQEANDQLHESTILESPNILNNLENVPIAGVTQPPMTIDENIHADIDTSPNGEKIVDRPIVIEYLSNETSCCPYKMDEHVAKKFPDDVSVENDTTYVNLPSLNFSNLSDISVSAECLNLDVLLRNPILFDEDNQSPQPGSSGKKCFELSNSGSPEISTIVRDPNIVPTNSTEYFCKKVNNRTPPQSEFIPSSSIELQNDSDQENIPTPFKKVLFWKPKIGEKEKVKRKLREKIPAVASSEKWKEFNNRKEAKKEKDEEEKRKRKQQRLENIKQREELKLKKKSKNKNNGKIKDLAIENNRKKNISFSSDTEIENVLTKPDNLEFDIGDYVIVTYDDSRFPGLIISVIKGNEEEFVVKTMTRSGPNWRWPNKDDILHYRRDEIVAKISKPKVLNKRGVYEISEMKN